MALTVPDGTLNVPPKLGVCAVVSPLLPAVTPELACDSATLPEVPDPERGELVVIPVIVPTLAVAPEAIPSSFVLSDEDIRPEVVVVASEYVVFSGSCQVPSPRRYFP